MNRNKLKVFLLLGAALFVLLAPGCTSDEAATAPPTLSCPIVELACFYDSTSTYVLYGDAYVYPNSSLGDLLIYKESKIVTDAKGTPVGMLNTSGSAIIDNQTDEPIVQMLKLGELDIVTPYIPEPVIVPDTSTPAPAGKYKMVHDMAWVLHADQDYLIYNNGDVSDVNCNIVGSITNHLGGDIVDMNGKTLVKDVNAAELDYISKENNIACPPRPASSSSKTPASSNTQSSSSKKPESSSSSGGGNSTPTGCPAIKTKGGSGSGWATRYWDCCKPSCSWNKNSGGKNSKQCTNKGRSENTNWDDGSICSGGSQMTCISQIPFTVSGCNDMGFAFAAVPASNGGQCGKCFQLTFTGEGHYNSTNANTKAIKGKKLIIMVTNVGGDVEQGQFDIMIPGGGLGIFKNGCSQMGWGNQGSEYGGLLSDCEKEHNYNAAKYKSCLTDKCNSVFSNDSEAKQGCLFLANWMNAAGNPEHNYVEVECPDVLKNKY
ncbi:glycosyl hydrolase family 5 [uncultured Fibrobacter sp.]|uniref:glycosyl hydrolase family 5 n=1 Tax=uncultured Fibrobacter sp. TaxID=261512 RepID=UPI0025F66418|nr:glycosyl hydrolase family 5 [uncultured Fibrobacter sp.]